MRAFVTGATGFVGSNLAAALAASGHGVCVLRRASSRMDALDGIPVDCATGDILDAASLGDAMAGCDVVFHVAAMSQYWRSDRATIYRVNVDGTRNVLAAAREAGVRRVIHTSSVAAIGYAPPGAVADESQAFPEGLAWWPYGHSKHLAEVEALKAVEGGLDAVIVNPGIVLGPRDVNFVSGSLIRASVRGQLRVVPPGGSNVVHVDDVVAGMLAAAERGRAGERYILGGENLSHWDMAAVIGEVTGGPGPVLTLPRWSLRPLGWLIDAANGLRRTPPLLKGEQLRVGGEAFYADSSKAVRELGLPQTPFRRAAEDAFTWYRARGLL
ncbi:MAG: SDR family oxidoreductase [Candidatus Hydrogenedentes bacterium]|nr:SDR family oxidoreductase [Candidatus Hydrogenedentota bacterium]